MDEVNTPMRGIEDTPWRRNLVGLIGLVFAVIFVALAAWTSAQTERDAAERLAHSYSEAIMGFRSYYAREIVGPVSGAVVVSEQWRDIPHAIPIPASMTLDLVAYLNERDAVLSIAQYSAYPFPWRAERQLTAAQHDALARLTERDENRMTWVERSDGQRMLHYAMAIRMENQTCVNCHNSHPDSPKTDWKLGEIRAIQVVSLPLQAGLLGKNLPFMMTGGFVVAAFVAGLLGLFFLDGQVRRALGLARRRADAHAAVVRELNERQFAQDQHAIVSITDASGNINYANEKFQQISGYPLEDLIGQNHRIVKSGLHPPEVYENLWATIASGKVWHGELCNRARKGSLYWVAATIVPFLDDEGKPRQYISIRTDITERKRFEHDIAVQRQFLQTLTNALGEGVYAIDIQGHCTFINPEGERLLAQAYADLENHSIHHRIHHHSADGEPLAARDCPLYHAMKAGEVLRSDTEVFHRPDGSAFPVALVAVPLWSEDRTQIIGQVVAFRDITEATRRRAELEQARDEAEKANRAKSEFLSSMSHELRTPLNAILGFAQLLEQSRKESLSDKQKGHVARILSGGKHLLKLINDILDLAKIEEGKMSLLLEPLNTRELLEDCLHTTRSLADPKGIAVTCPACEKPDLPWIVADLTRTRQILLNLLSNAVKYNRSRGTVTVLAQDQGEYLRLGVADTGYGIPAHQQNKLFQPFSRLGHENTGIEGTGIGLTITKRLIEMMGGAIGFSSEDGVGSTFWVDLPISHPRKGQARLAEQPDGEHAEHEVGNASNQAILYVEDNPANLAFMEAVVEELDGYVLLSAPTAELGVQMALANPPDMILMDINLPGMDGFGALKILKADARTAHIPVIALSADAMPATVRRGEEAGFVAYLTKPVQIATLVEIFSRFQK